MFSLAIQFCVRDYSFSFYLYPFKVSILNFLAIIILCYRTFAPINAIIVEVTRYLFKGSKHVAFFHLPSNTSVRTDYSGRGFKQA